MANSVLGDYAMLFLIGIFAYVVFSACWCYSVDGSAGAFLSILLSIVGMWLSLHVVNLFDFQNASLETVLTTIFGTFLLPTIYNIRLARKCIMEERNSKIDIQPESYKQKMEWPNNQLDGRDRVQRLLLLLKYCNEDVTGMKNINEMMGVKQTDDAIKEIP